VSSPRPFRFGLVAYDGPADVVRWRELARRAEALGYSSLLLGDHVMQFLPFGGASPMLALADAAAVTTKLRVGTAMLANDYRHPALVAKEAATLDLLSEGRLELGIGAGWLQADYQALGIPYDPASTRIDRLAEAVRVIKLAWAEEPFDFKGEHYTLRDYQGLPKPVQRPGPPLVIGGGTPRVLRTAGGLADIVGIHVSTSAAGAENRAAEASEHRLLRKLEWIRSGAGPRFAALELQMTVFALIVANRPEEAARQAAARHHAGLEELARSVMSLVGTVDSVCDELRRRRDVWGVSYVTVDAAMCEVFAPVVARLAGT
jgi:probable F420-dependent oxidoreductase